MHVEPTKVSLLKRFIECETFSCESKSCTSYSPITTHVCKKGRFYRALKACVQQFLKSTPGQFPRARNQHGTGPKINKYLPKRGQLLTIYNRCAFLLVNNELFLAEDKSFHRKIKSTISIMFIISIQNQMNLYIIFVSQKSSRYVQVDVNFLYAVSR